MSYEKKSFIALFILLGILLSIGSIIYLVTSGSKTEPGANQGQEPPTPPPDDTEPPPDDTEPPPDGGPPPGDWPKPGNPVYLLLHWPDQPDAGMQVAYMAIQTIATMIVSKLLDEINRRMSKAGVESKRGEAAGGRKPGVTPDVNRLASKKVRIEIDNLRSRIIPTSQRFSQIGRNMIQSLTIKHMTEGRIPVDDLGNMNLDANNIEKPSYQSLKTKNLHRLAVGHFLTPREILRTSTTSRIRYINQMIKRLDVSTKIGRTAKIAFETARLAVNFLEKIEVPLLFLDAFLVAKFPDESEFLSPEMVRNVKWETVKSQIDFITKFNNDIIDPWNENPNNVNKSLYPRERAQFPIIMGPLDKLDPDDEIAKYVGAEQRHKRAKMIIYGVCEKLLRTEGNPHRYVLYNEPKFLPGNSLTNWATNIYQEYDRPDLYGREQRQSLTQLFMDRTFFTTAQQDNLYRDAYTIVCNNYNGVVYEDTHGTNNTSWTGRPRFQCGFRGPTECAEHAKEHMETGGETGGDFAEWYTYTEVNSLLNDINPSNASVINACVEGDNVYKSSCTPRFISNGQSGMCMVTNSYMAMICDGAQGIYNYETHMCEYTQEFCQEMGMCFDRVNKVCQLPSETMFALSCILGGTGGVREWIKIHGCGFSGSDLDFNNIITTAGQYAKDMVRDKSKINEGFQKTFDPSTSQGRINIYTIIMAVGGPVTTVALAIAMALEIGGQFAETNREENQYPPKSEDYPLEYAITGLSRDRTQPVQRAYADGWLTKPIPAHVLTNWPPPVNYAASNIVTIEQARETSRDYYEHQKRSVMAEWDSYSDYSRELWVSFFANGFEDAIETKALTLVRPRIPTDIANTPTVSEIEFFDETSDLTAAIRFYNTIEEAITAFTTIRHRTKLYCYDRGKMRAGSNAIRNQTWCIDYQPPVQYADIYNIGELATANVQVTDGQSITDEILLTSRAWTNGYQYDVPQYPTNDRQGAEWGNRPGLWFYQLVYDKDKMVPDSNGMPLRLWDTNYLSKFFSDLTIQEMRQYYCTTSFTGNPDNETVESDSTGVSVDDRCWGYLNMSIPKYKYLRMTLPQA
jgi:hypothetical protein